ncbi:MAG: hypothetical protein HUK19_09280 [Fibrobacter sp.]|nr:hypothetical protein [Fibrobacter sp.]
MKIFKLLLGRYSESIQDDSSKKYDADCLIYKPLAPPISILGIIVLCILGSGVLLFVLFFANWNSSVLLCIFWGIACLWKVYKEINAIVEIRWLKEGFVLRNRLGEKSFTFEKKELKKFKHIENGFVKFVFGKEEWELMTVDERIFPEVVRKMKLIFCDEREKLL